MSQPWKFTHLDPGVEFAGLAKFTGGGSRLNVQPATDQASEGAELIRVTRSAVEDTNPGVRIYAFAQSGTITMNGVSPRIIFGDQAAAERCRIVVGTNTPEGAITAPVGSLFLRTNGGATTTLYVKESGTGNTGWVAK